MLPPFRFVIPDPLPLITPPALTTKFDEIVTAWLAAPRLAALFTVTLDPNVCAWLQLFSILEYATVLGNTPEATVPVRFPAVKFVIPDPLPEIMPLLFTIRLVETKTVPLNVEDDK